MSRSATGSSTLIVVLILVLLSGSCLALLVATQTQMLIASQLKLRTRLLAAAEGGLELTVARGMAGAADHYTVELGEGPLGTGITVESAPFVPLTEGACHLCMANLDGTLASLGGLRRVRHLAGASALSASRGGGLPAPRRAVSSVVELMPWPGKSAQVPDFARAEAMARDTIRDLARSEGGGYDDGAPLALAVLDDPAPSGPRTVAVGGLGRSGDFLYAVEVSPWARPLWRFGDPADQDGDGAPDLGRTLSRPAIVRLRMGEVERPVAVFGGGFHPERPDRSGNWIYMVGMDSGRLVYKRELDAPAPAAPAVVDLDGDGLADRIYVGTTAGSLYRVELSPAVELENGRVPPGSWRPRRVFESGGAPIHHPPAAIPLTAAGGLALAFGAGGVADPGSAPATSVAGRFFVAVDPGTGAIGAGDALAALDPASPALGVDRLSSGGSASARGWSLVLDEGERPASAVVAAGGLLTFLTFQRTSAAGGAVRAYSLDLNSGDAADGLARFLVVDRNVRWQGPGSLGVPVRIDVDSSGGLGSPLAPREERIAGRLEEGMTDRCRSSGARLRLAASGPEGSSLGLAVLPVCRIDSDWAESD